MKTLFLTNEYPPHVYGGAGIHVEYLSRELAKLMEVEVRCFGDQDEKGGPLVVKGYQADKQRFAQTDPKLKSPFSAMSNCIAFNADPIDADVVHCHTWYSHFGGILAKISYGIPLVVSTHSLEPHRPWKREQLGRGYDLSSWVEKTTMEMADAVIAVSRGMKQDVIDLFDVYEQKIKVIYNGIDTDEFKPVSSRESLAKYGIDPDSPYVLFFGRVTRQKGIIHLVNAIQYLDDNIQVVLCAGQPDTPEIGQEMEEKVKAVQQTRDNVIWISEWVDKGPKIELYTHAAVFCCPSIYEPFGIINLEAMACGTPVVGSAVGGIKEIILHGETGYLVELEQQQAAPYEAVHPDKYARDLAAGINAIVADESLRQSMGVASRKRTEDVFSWKAIAQETLELYKTLV
ncbi:MAG: glycogen synthase [Anaerolineae bacterium]|nr:glycogen synthase [Anaerolineae bacterium]